MLGLGNFYGYGSKAEYVKFLASRGTPVTEIAQALRSSVVQLMAECPEIDFYKYQIMSQPAHGGWSNEQIRLVLDNFGEHGPDWDGWRALLPDRSQKAIKACASQLGLYYVRKRRD